MTRSRNIARVEKVRKTTLLFGAALAGCLILVTPEATAADGVLWNWTRSGDACLSMGTVPDVTGDGRAELVAGFHSGSAVCFRSDLSTPTVPLWTATLQGAVLTFVPLPAVPTVAPARVVASTDYGWVACIIADGTEAGTVDWSFKASCAMNVLAAYPDVDGDETNEILASGADQRVHLLNGATGAEIWTRALGTESGGGGYVQALAIAGDLNADARADVFVLGWESKKLWALNGTNGVNLWTPVSGSNYTEAMVAAGDLTGDGLVDALVGGNDLRMNLYSGANGSNVWYFDFGRAMRAVLTTGDVNGDGGPDCFGASAGGLVACVIGAGGGARTALWTAQVDDGCRSLTSPGDLDGDGKPDVAVSTESGSVTMFSGATGQILWRWQGGDVVRLILSLPDRNADGRDEVAVCSIDGTVAVLSGNPADWPALPGSTSKDMAKAAASSRSAVPPPGDTTPPSIASEPPIEELTAAATAPSRMTTTAAATDVPVLLYHDILPEMIYTYGASEENFRSQMDMVVAGGYTCVSLDQIADWIAGTTELPDNPICITFDGPYDGQFTYAMPILRDRGLTATVYCTTDWIGGPNRADWHQLRQMEDSGVFHVENHTIYHANLTTLSHDAVTSQVGLCNASILRHLNGKIALHHAYPGGGYNATVMGYLRDMGLRTATTVVQRHVVRTDDPMAVPRYSVVRSTTLPQFASKIRYTGPIPPPTPTPTPTPAPSPTPEATSGQAWWLY